MILIHDIFVKLFKLLLSSEKMDFWNFYLNNFPNFRYFLNVLFFDCFKNSLSFMIKKKKHQGINQK